MKDLIYNTGLFTIEEYSSNKNQIMNRKSEGPDEILSEILKNFDLNETVLIFVNKLLVEGKKNYCSICNIIPISKKGSLNKQNERGINVTIITMKLK